MSNTLPPLPEPTLEAHEYEIWGQNVNGDFYTAEQMQAYATAALQAQGAPVVPVNCRQRLKSEGKAYARSNCASCGELSPKWKECDAMLASTHPAPQQKPLTDEQIKDCLDAADQMYCPRDGDKEIFKARAIEAAHNIGEKK